MYESEYFEEHSKDKKDSTTSIVLLIGGIAVVCGMILTAMMLMASAA